MGRKRIELLRRLGFIIEDMSEQAYGEDFTGWFRWNFNETVSRHCYAWKLEVWRDAWKYAVAKGLVN